MKTHKKNKIIKLNDKFTGGYNPDRKIDTRKKCVCCKKLRLTGYEGKSFICTPCKIAYERQGVKFTEVTRSIADWSQLKKIDLTKNKKDEQKNVFKKLFTEELQKILLTSFIPPCKFTSITLSNLRKKGVIIPQFLNISNLVATLRRNDLNIPKHSEVAELWKEWIITQYQKGKTWDYIFDVLQSTNCWTKRNTILFVRQSIETLPHHTSQDAQLSLLSFLNRHRVATM